MLDLRRGEDGAVVLSGRLDAAQAPRAQEFLDAQAALRIVDCTDLDYISSAGLGVLLRIQKRLAETGSGLKLINVNKHIRDVFHYSGLDQIFEIESSG